MATAASLPPLLFGSLENFQFNLTGACQECVDAPIHLGNLSIPNNNDLGIRAPLKSFSLRLLGFFLHI